MPKRVLAAGAPQVPRKQAAFFSGPCANLWEDLLVKSGTQFLLGSKPSQADATAVKEMGGLRPNPATHPNLYFWYSMVSKFNPAVSGKWPAGDLPMPAAAAK